jgi:hypothetical protein
MARRRILVLTWVTVYWDPDWNEYQVEPRWGNSLEKERARYHTSDKEDALDTARVMNHAYQNPP